MVFSIPPLDPREVQDDLDRLENEGGVVEPAPEEDRPEDETDEEPIGLNSEAE